MSNNEKFPGHQEILTMRPKEPSHGGELGNLCQAPGPTDTHVHSKMCMKNGHTHAPANYIPLPSIHPARLGYTHAPANTRAPANYIPLPSIEPNLQL